MRITNQTSFEPLHPQRWPLHNDPEKGQILNGDCNTYGCTCGQARHWCALTFAFYCEDCALQINQGPSPSCEPAFQKPDLQEMQSRHRYAYKAYRR